MNHVLYSSLTGNTKKVAEALKQKGAIVLGSYHTKGRAFVVVNIGHPCRDGLGGAMVFARGMARLG